jgi:hypothetical protein
LGHILEYVGNAKDAKGAFEAANHGLGRIGRKEFPAVLANRTNL